MTTIWDSCSSCGDVRLTVADVEVTVHPIAAESTYCFTCPQCGLQAVVHTNRRTLTLLMATGVTGVVWASPRLSIAEPISSAEIDEFGRAVDDDAVFAMALDEFDMS